MLSDGRPDPNTDGIYKIFVKWIWDTKSDRCDLQSGRYMPNFRKIRGRESFRRTYGFRNEDKIVMSVGLYFRQRKGILDFVELAGKCRSISLSGLAIHRKFQIQRKCGRRSIRILPDLFLCRICSEGRNEKGVQQLRSVSVPVLRRDGRNRRTGSACLADPGNFRGTCRFTEISFRNGRDVYDMRIIIKYRVRVHQVLRHSTASDGQWKSAGRRAG